MSAYALFPPIKKSSDASTGNCSLQPITYVVSSPLECRMTTPTKPNPPPGQEDEIHDKVLQQLLDEDSNSRDIAVKEAKIDPVRLVQVLTGGSSHSSSSPRKQSPPSPRKTLRRRSITDRLTSSSRSLSSGSSSSSSSSSGDKEKQQQCAESGTPHEDAIQFELSISLNGRKYTATRTLQCIVQLRNDLIREAKYRRQWLINRNKNVRRQRHNQKVKQTCEKDSAEFDEKDDQEDDTLEQIQIPEIPPITTGDAAALTFFPWRPGRGFTMLAAMLKTYRPAMEDWLRSVIAVVPQDSECLMNFLWEPVSKEVQIEFANSCPSISKLGSIKELDLAEGISEEGTESDDEWDV